MANIKLNNNEYPIPDSVLDALTADFIAHLGTIAGEGLKIIINGVEYGVDTNKVGGAVFELEGAFDSFVGADTEGNGIKLLSFDNLILKDSNGVSLLAKEGN